MNKKEKKRNLIDLVLIFFSFSFAGWLWELIYDLLNTGNLANHGVLLGPWLPIYGFGSVFIYIFLDRYKKCPAVVFMGAFVLCTIVEYLTGWYLETYLNHRWWTYYDMPFNIDGRICLLSSIFFGIAGLAGIYVGIPKLKKFFSRFEYKKILIACLLLTSIFIVDFVYSTFHPNIVKKHKIIDTEKLGEIKLFKK